MRDDVQMRVTTFALPKGRLLKESVELLSSIGLDCSGLLQGRELVAEDEKRATRYLLVRPSDVPTYVEQGVADLGIVGKDVLLEADKEVYELLDLRFGSCRFVVAAPRGWIGGKGLDGVISKKLSPLKVATKFPNVTRSFFRERGIPVEVIPLKGAVELAPVTGLAEAIVDLVSTGRTLRANGLEEVEQIGTVTARLIANPVSFKLNADRIMPLVEMLRQKAAEGGGGTGA